MAAKIAINLLPNEFEAEKKQKQKNSRVLQISVVVLVVFILIAVAVLGYRFFQNSQLASLQTSIKSVKEKISSPENVMKEGFVITLNNRLASLEQVSKINFPASTAMDTLIAITPVAVKINGFSVDKKGQATLATETQSTTSLQELMNNITDQDKTQKKVSTSSVDTLVLTKEGKLQTNITATLITGDSKK